MSLSPSIRIFIAGVLFVACGSCLHAQSTQDISSNEVNSIALSGPQSDSPFFIERQQAQQALLNAGREGYGMYVPKPPQPSAQQRLKKLFKGILSPTKLFKKKNSLPIVITVEPSEFSIANHPDLTISLKITNAQRQEVEFLYPSDQRLEIVTKDSTGTVINKWSQDRAFDPTEGFAEINPSEFIIYAEKLSTTPLKAGETYTIEASLAGQDGLLASTTITPQP